VSTSPRPKSVAIAVILGALVTGAVLGLALGRSMRREERDPRAELARELTLSPEQQVQFDSIFAWRRRNSRQIMATVQPALDSVRDSSRVLMLSTLDSTQRIAFRALIERNRRSADSSGRARPAR